MGQVAMLDPIIHQLLNEAATKWMAVTGTNPDRTSFRVRFDGGWDDLDLDHFLKDINQAQELDPSGITTFMLLRGAAESYLKDLNISAMDFLTKPLEVEAKVAPLRELRELLENEHVIQTIEDFMGWIRAASAHYGLSEQHNKALDKLMANKLQLAYVRRDALRSIETLQANQFVHGKADTKDLKYNPGVYEFWNVNSLVKAMQAQLLSGITLCMVRDPGEPMFSFFCIAIRNGQSLTVLCDQESLPHPGAKRMSRRPDRILSKRAERHRFPYDLLDLQTPADGKDQYIKDSKELVPINVTGVKLTSLGELHPDTFVWLTMLFELIKERYGTQNLQLPETSYTGEMIVNPHALVDTHGALVKDGQYQPIELPPLRGEDVTAETTADQWVEEPRHYNRWMMERYASQVPEAVLNPVGAEQLLTLGSGETGLTFSKSEETGHNTLEGGHLNGSCLQRYPVEFETMDPITFGTKETLVRDRLWVARMNQVKVVEALALKEFDETKDAVLQWYQEAVAKNVGPLVEAAVRGTFVLPSLQPKNGEWAWARDLVMVTRECLDQGTRKNMHFHAYSKVGMDKGCHLSRYNSGSLFICGGSRNPYSGATNFYCYGEGLTVASVYTKIKPDCPEALAVLCGLSSVEELPWQLRHWSTEEPYVGNPILNRLDPEEWNLDNPWKSLELEIWIMLSKNYIHSQRKALGLPRATWG